MNKLTDTEKAFLRLQNICIECREAHVGPEDIFHVAQRDLDGICRSCALDMALKILREFNVQYK